MAKLKKTILKESLPDQEYNIALIRESIKKNRDRKEYAYAGDSLRRHSSKKLRMTAKQQAKEEKEKLWVNWFLDNIIWTDYIKDRNELIEFLEVLKSEQRELYWIKIIVDKVRSPSARYFIENWMEVFWYKVDNECIWDSDWPINSREKIKDPDYYTGMMWVWGATRFPLREYEYRIKRVWLDYDELLSYARTGESNKETSIMRFL